MIKSRRFLMAMILLFSIPELATSWDEDPQCLSVTFHLRKGVQFHDGSQFNAEAVKWNFGTRMEKNAMTDQKYIKSIDIFDDYTLKINVTAFNNQLALNYNWVQIFSKAAFEKSGVDLARTHCVGTAPFKLGEFKRDNLIAYVKNDNYWRKGYPYLDGMEVRFIPDAMVMQPYVHSKYGYVHSVLWQPYDDWMEKH